MPDTFKPWERNSAFTAERLSQIATALRDARDNALDSYEPLKGETAWSLGCCQYDRSTFTIREMAKSNPTWLNLVPEVATLRCTFAIEGMPIRFYHQTADDPPAKYTASTDGEDRQFQMLFEVDGVPFRKTLYRLAIKNYATQRVESIVLLEFDDSGACVNEYTIPFGLAPSKVLPIQAKAVNLAPIKLEPIESERPDEQAENDKDHKSDTGTK
jgi:hypothetical protein